MRSIVLGILCMVVVASAMAQEKGLTKTAIYVMASCSDDSVGQRLAYNLREEIRRAATLRDVDSYIESTVAVRLICLHPSESEKGSVTHYAYSSTYLNKKGYYDYHIKDAVGICGTQRVVECADAIMAGLDVEVSEIRAKIKDGSFRP